MSSATAAAGMSNVGMSFTIDAIPTPGAYLCDWSGHLLRLPHEAFSQRGNSGATWNIVGGSPLTVTKLSDDPYIPLQNAKQIAGKLNRETTF